MKTLTKNKEYLLFIIAIFLFIIYKIPHLSLPLFWDEMGVYGKSVFFLLDHEIGLQPKYLAPELSRGHPMLYVYLTAIFSKLFGSNVFSMHLFNLFVALVGLFSVFYISKNLFSKQIALLSTLFIIIQPLFLAQSIMVLPELLLAILMLWSIYFFLKEKWILYFLFSSLAMLTKETAIILPFVFAFIYFFWNLLIKKQFTILKPSIIFLPILTFFIFLLIQKSQNGWYFFPYHNPFDGDKGFFEITVIYQKFKDFIHFIYIEQGRWLLFVISLIIFLFTFFTWDSKKKYKIVVFITVIFALVLFSSTNHFMKRYMLLALFLNAIIYGVILNQILKSKFSFFIIVFCFRISLMHTKSNTFMYDENMSYIEFIDFQKQLTSFLENQKDWNDGVVLTSNFPMKLSFEDKRYGFSKQKISVVLNSKIEKNTDYIIETNPGSWRNFQIPEKYTKIEFPSKGFNSVKIYRKNK